MIAEYKNIEADIIARIWEIVHLIAEDPELQTDFIRSAYAVFLMEVHDLGYLDDGMYLLFMREIHPTYYWELLTHDESTQKMYLRCQYEARKFGAYCDLFPRGASTNSLPYYRGGLCEIKCR